MPLVPGCQCQLGQRSGRKAEASEASNSSWAPDWERRPCQSGGRALHVMEQREAVVGHLGPGPTCPAKQGCISSPAPILSPHHSMGDSCLGSGLLLLSVGCDVPRACILHGPAPPTAAARSSFACPVQPSSTEMAQGWTPQQPVTMCLASWPLLRPLSLPSRPLPELALAGGDQRILFCPPAALPLVRLLASHSLFPLFPNVSLPNLPSLHPFSLSLLPLRHRSFLPGTGRLSSVAPNQGPQPEGLVVLCSAPGP